MQLNFEQIKEILPQRFPLLMIDKVLDYVPGDRLLAVKLISGSEPVLQGHYPGFAIFPGVYLIETMAQAASILAFRSRTELDLRDNGDEVHLLTSVDRARFRSPALPGSVLHIEARFKSKKMSTIYFEVSIKCEDTRICDCVLSCSLVKLETFKKI